MENALESQFYVQTMSQLGLCKALHLNIIIKKDVFGHKTFAK